MQTASTSTDWIDPATGAGSRYLAAAASGLMSAPVLSAMVGHLELEATIGGVDAAGEAAPSIGEGYAAAARLMNCDLGEVAFCESGNRGLQSVFLSADLKPGDRVLVSRGEWGGSLAMLRALGVEVEPLETDPLGYVDLAKLERSIPGARMVLLSWVAATNGVVQPAEAVGKIASTAGVLFVVDACQVFGQLPVDVPALRCAALVSSGRKWLRGPRGTAVVFASRDFLAGASAFVADQFGAPLKDGAWVLRPDARRFETGERSVAAHLGLASALVGAEAIGVSNIAAHCGKLAKLLREGLAEASGVQVHEGLGPVSAIVTFNVHGLSADRVKASLTAEGFRVSAVASSYAPFDMAARGLSGVIRLAPHVYNDHESADLLVKAVSRLDGRASP